MFPSRMAILILSALSFSYSDTSPFFVQVTSYDPTIDRKYLYPLSRVATEKPYLTLDVLGFPFILEESSLISTDDCQFGVSIPLLRLTNSNIEHGFSLDSEGYVNYNNTKDQWMVCKNHNNDDAAYYDAFIAYIEDQEKLSSAKEYCEPVLLTAKFL